jgi:hypothetical protein
MIPRPSKLHACLEILCSEYLVMLYVHVLTCTILNGGAAWGDLVRVCPVELPKIQIRSAAGVLRFEVLMLGGKPASPLFG